MSNRPPHILYLDSHDHATCLEKFAGARRFAAAVGWQIVRLKITDSPRRLRALLARLKPDGCLVNATRLLNALPPAAFGSTPVVYLDTDTRLFGRTCCVVAHDSDATGRRAADELLKLNLARYAFLPYRRPTFWSDLRGSYGGLSPPHHAFVSPSTLTKNVAAGRFTSSSFKSSGGSRYCSAGEGNPATTDPATCAFFDITSPYEPSRGAYAFQRPSYPR